MNSFFLLGNTPELLDAPLTYVILAITVYTSYRLMEPSSDKEKLVFNPYKMKRTQEWYRFFSHGLIHNDWMHLGLNSFVLLIFGSKLEMILPYYFGVLSTLIYLALYASGLIMASLYTYYKQQDNPRYSAVGASGTISGILFATILLTPFDGIGIILISDITGLYLPGLFFAIAYLAYSSYKDKQGGGRVAHDVHYWGAVWGFIFLIVIRPAFFFEFLEQVRYYVMSFF